MMDGDRKAILVDGHLINFIKKSKTKEFIIEKTESSTIIHDLTGLKKEIEQLKEDIKNRDIDSEMNLASVEILKSRLEEKENKLKVLYEMV